MSNKYMLRFWIILLVGLPIMAQDKSSSSDKQVTKPVVQESKKKPQENAKTPQTTPTPPKEKGKSLKTFGIRPPANNDSGNNNSGNNNSGNNNANTGSNTGKGEKRPPATFGIRPPASNEENKTGDKSENKATDKPSKSSGGGVAEKSKKSSTGEIADKKPKTPSKTQNRENKSQFAAEPQVIEPAPSAVAPTPIATAPVPKSAVTTGPADDPKFGAYGSTSSVRQDVETGFLNRAVRVGNTVYRYQVFVPRNWTPRQAWPVILFLHGAGERGDDGFMQTDIGLGSAIRRDASRFPAIVVMPQCRKNGFWTEESMQAQAMAALEQSIGEFNGDRTRLYLTGLSMGGYGTWGLAAQHAGKFAAYVAVCGGLKMRDGRTMVNVKADDPYAIVARLVGQTPTWIFHGGDDKVVLPDESRKMHEAIKAAGGNVQYTEYPGVAHNSWDKAYAEPKLVEWLLAQKLKK